MLIQLNSPGGACPTALSLVYVKKCAKGLKLNKDRITVCMCVCVRACVRERERALP